MTSKERHEVRYRRRRAKRQAKKAGPLRQPGRLEQTFTFRKMFMWGKKCCNGVRWKQSTQNLSCTFFPGRPAAGGKSGGTMEAEEMHTLHAERAGKSKAH